MFIFFFFNDTATTEIYTLSLHDALPILMFIVAAGFAVGNVLLSQFVGQRKRTRTKLMPYECGKDPVGSARSEEHTSELQSRQYLVCRLLLEKKKKTQNISHDHTYTHNNC